MNAPAAAAAAIPLPDFLAWEHRQPERWERVGGVVRLMAGGIRAHDRISTNVTALLWAALRGARCEAHGSNLKVVSPRGDAMYPDAFVRCGPCDDRATAVDDPVIVIEVLSEGTARHDLTRKRHAYESIPSLRRILYVAVDEARVDVRARDGGDAGWRDEVVEGLGVAVALPEIGAELPLAAVYEGTDVAAAAAAAAG